MRPCLCQNSADVEIPPMPLEPANASTETANLVEIRGLHYAIGDRVLFADLSLDIPRASYHRHHGAEWLWQDDAAPDDRR